VPRMPATRGLGTALTAGISWLERPCWPCSANCGFLFRGF
jgi:hypothetical protein